MFYRVSFVGASKWLQSPHVCQLRRDARLLVTPAQAPEPSGKLPRSAAHVVVLQMASSAALRSCAQLGPACRGLAAIPARSQAWIRRCIELNLWGVISETATAESYFRAITQVAAGKLVYPLPILDRIVTRGGRMTLRRDADEVVAELNRQERQFLTLLAMGLTSAAAAKALKLPAGHGPRLYTELRRKLDAKNRAKLVRLAVEAGLVPPNG